MDKSSKQYAKWNMSVTKGQIQRNRKNGNYQGLEEERNGEFFV